MVPITLPLISGIGLGLIAATLLTGTTAYLYWMVPIVGIMLANAATDAWNLMLGLARYKVRHASNEDVMAERSEEENSQDELLAPGS
jgi:hypothetical protein